MGTRWAFLLVVPLWALVYWRAGLPIDALKWYLLAALLVAITETDLRAKLIPDKITFPGTIAGLLLALPGTRALGMALAGAAVGFFVLEIFRRVMGRIATMEVMGMGDSKLLMMCGAYLGPGLILLSILPGVLIGLVFGIAYTRLAKSPHFPFGPCLGLGAFLTGLFPGEIRDALLALPQTIQGLGPAARLSILAGCVVALVVVLRRLRKRAAQYTRAIEEDYASREKDEPTSRE